MSTATMTMPSVDAVTAKAIKRASKNANAAWRAFMLNIVKGIAESKATLTTDDVRAAYENLEGEKPYTGTASAIGPVMLEAELNGFISLSSMEPTSVKSTRPESHGRRITLWISNLFNRVA